MNSDEPGIYLPFRGRHELQIDWEDENVASRLAADASALYARNLFNFLQLIIDKDSHELQIDWEDEIIKGTCITRGGQIAHPGLATGEGD